MYRRDEVRIIIPIYVDDMTIAIKSKQQYESVRDELAKHFKLHELGPTSFLLSVHIERDRSKHSISLSQRQYIIDVLERFSMGDCSTVTTTLPTYKLSKDMAPKTPAEVEHMKQVPYRQWVHSCIWLLQPGQTLHMQWVS